MQTDEKAVNRTFSEQFDGSDASIPNTMRGGCPRKSRLRSTLQLNHQPAGVGFATFNVQRLPP
jgi:hypothetical protein